MFEQKQVDGALVSAVARHQSLVFSCDSLCYERMMYVLTSIGLEDDLATEILSDLQECRTEDLFCDASKAISVSYSCTTTYDNLLGRQDRISANFSGQQIPFSIEVSGHSLEKNSFTAIVRWDPEVASAESHPPVLTREHLIKLGFIDNVTKTASEGTSLKTHATFFQQASVSMPSRPERLAITNLNNQQVLKLLKCIQACSEQIFVGPIRSWLEECSLVTTANFSIADLKLFGHYGITEITTSVRRSADSSASSIDLMTELDGSWPEFDLSLLDKEWELETPQGGNAAFEYYDPEASFLPTRDWSPEESEDVSTDHPWHQLLNTVPRTSGEREIVVKGIQCGVSVGTLEITVCSNSITGTSGPSHAVLEIPAKGDRAHLEKVAHLFSRAINSSVAPNPDCFDLAQGVQIDGDIRLWITS